MNFETIILSLGAIVLLWKLGYGNTVKRSVDVRVLDNGLHVPPEYASPHFKWADLTVSGSQPELARRAAGDWTPATRSNMLKLLSTVVEPLRVHIGKPFYVNSGYRPLYLNRAVGSEDKSQHVTGDALDFKPAGGGESVTKIFNWGLLNKSKFGQMIFYRGNPAIGESDKVTFIHISNPGGHLGDIRVKYATPGYIPISEAIR